MFGNLRMIMGSGSVLGYFLQALPIACLAGIVYLVIRAVMLRKRKAPVRWGMELLRLIFVCYLTGLISLVILPANFWLYFYDGVFLGWWYGFEQMLRLGDINLMPSLIRWLNGELSIGSWVRTMLIGNVLMFVPMGLLLPLITRIGCGRRMLAAAVLIPVGCETLQLLFGRSFDVDDLICNFIGIVIGAAVAFAIRKVQPAGEERG